MTTEAGFWSEIDENALEAWSKCTDYKWIGYQQRDKHLAMMGFGSYADYLNSDLWFWIRKRFLNSHEKRNLDSRVARQRCCWCCGSGFNLQIHHAEYSLQTLAGNLQSRDSLVILCRCCHEGIEISRVGRKRSVQEANFLIFAFMRSKPSFAYHERIHVNPATHPSSYCASDHSPIEFLNKSDVARQEEVLAAMSDDEKMF